MAKPNVLFIMTDQQRADTISSLGNSHIYTPNLDRLVRRGVSFTNAYSTCAECVPARYTIRTGCSPFSTRVFANGAHSLNADHPGTVSETCGDYIADTMKALGYSTFGVGKFHTIPWDEPVGYDIQSYSEELYGTPEQRNRDGFASFVAREHPEYNFVEGLMGERTDMYYIPQMSPMPADITVEAWAADRAVELIETTGDRPYFGFVSFVGPHPPFAPPIPYNRMYDPDSLPDAVCGEMSADHQDDFIPWMNYLIWAEDISNLRIRSLKARYYGEISYIDHCLGRILDSVESRPDADNTLICFFADHGELLGDHHGWQKESFFEASARIPYLVSWPKVLPAGVKNSDLVCLEDLFGIATTAAGTPDLREGIDLLGTISGSARPRDVLYGVYGQPGDRISKYMIRRGPWKYIFLTNGRREQLFNLDRDPDELHECGSDHEETLEELGSLLRRKLEAEGEIEALVADGIAGPEFEELPKMRVYQFDRSRGISGFPERPELLV